MDTEKLTKKQIEALLKSGQATPAQLAALRADTRASVARALGKWERNQAEIARVSELYKYERKFRQKGNLLIAGVDEAGRGPLAGPVFVAAVILPFELYIPKLNDSKKLSPKAREEVYRSILENAIAVQREAVDEKTIDDLNIYQATKRGMYEVLRALPVKADAAFIDAVKLDALKIPQLPLIKGDALSASIAAASIVAKVERDRAMDRLDELYPKYGFAKNKGYGTPEHMAAIRKYGPCPAHRRSFEPIKSWGESKCQSILQ